MSAPYPVNPTAPYPVDPSKGPAGNAGWTMPNAPGSYPVQPGYAGQPGFTNPGYNPQAPYPVQPVSPGQPGAAFPVEPPPPYSAQQGFVGQPGPYVSISIFTFIKSIRECWIMVNSAREHLLFISRNEISTSQYPYKAFEI